MNPSVSPSPYSAGPYVPAQDRAQQPMTAATGTARTHTVSNSTDTGQRRCAPEQKRRKVSLCDAVHLPLTEPTACPHEPVPPPGQTVVAAQPAKAITEPDRRAVKTALQHLAADTLNPADFIVLVNRFGYQTPLHHFSLDSLQPSDWLQLKEHNCQEILRYHSSFFAQMPPAAITSDICLTVYMACGADMFGLVPQPLRDSFFTQLVDCWPVCVVDIPAKYQTFERLLSACCHDATVLKELSDEQRSVPLITEVCQRTGYGLEYLPYEKRSYNLCLKACETCGKALEHVPNEHKDEKLCQAALSTYGAAFIWCLKYALQQGKVPVQASETVCSVASATAVRKPADHTTKDVYGRVDQQRRWQICLTTQDPLECRRCRPNNMDGFYERLLKENSWASLEWIPAHCRTPMHYLLACQKNGRDLQLVPEPHRTAQVCLAACRARGAALQWVPKQLRSATVCQAACQYFITAVTHVPQGRLSLSFFVQAMLCRVHSPHFLLTHARRILSETDFQRFVERSFIGGNRAQMTMLTHPQVSDAQKRALIEWMLQPELWPAPQLHKDSDLCELASPLCFALNNPELEQLLQTAVHVAEGWTPPSHAGGQRLLREIERAASLAAVERPDHNEPLLQTEGSTAGGRTLKFEQGEQACYYKFQRQKESLQTLMQEGIVHTVREKHPELFGPLQSKLPGDTRFFKLYLDQLPAPLPKFDDPLAIEQDEQGRRYVHVYRYRASTDYSVYAHKADPCHPDNPYHKGEQGILTACHDIGVFVARGLVPTSTLPVFHDSDSGRQWMALHALFGYQYSAVHPGKFCDWNGGATEYCDFGYGGFRDVGDFEPFGKIESFTKKRESRVSLHVPEVEQSLSLLNAVCENLIAANLIRARLRQTGSDYHYKNPKAQKQSQAFIEQTLLSFLKGMYADRLDSTESARRFLRARLDLDEPAYKRWLTRATAEVLYWTAQQPSVGQPDLPPFPDNGLPYSHKDGYALHLNRTGRLDPELYPHEKINKNGNGRYPSLFCEPDGQLNLGAYNSLFPLTTLMRALVRLCTGMLTYNHNGPELSAVSRE